MTKQKIEKKKVEKLTLKNMKKRHWVGVATVGVALGIMIGNLGGNAPADAKTVTATTGGITIENHVTYDTDETITFSIENEQGKPAKGLFALRDSKDQIVKNIFLEDLPNGQEKELDFGKWPAGTYKISLAGKGLDNAKGTGVIYSKEFTVK